MLDVVVHVPVDEAADRVHMDRAAVQPVVDDIVGEAAMLQQAGQHMMPGAIEAGQADEHQRQDGAHRNRRRDRGDIDGKPDARDADGLRLLHLRNEGFLFRADDAGGVAQHVDHGMPDIEKAEEVQDQPQQIRRAHHGNLGVTADDDRVGVMARMAPAPGHRIAHDHEAGDLIDRIVHPARLEGRAVAAFVPAAIGGRAVEHPIGEEERQRARSPQK